MALMLLAGSFVFVGPASATNIVGATSKLWCGPTEGDTGRLNKADDYYHTFYYSSGVSQNMMAAQDAVRVYLLDPTTIQTVRVSQVSTTTNVVVYEQDYTNFCQINWHDWGNPTGAAGAVQCVSLASDGSCVKHEARYDYSFESTAPNQDYREGLACHESGHTLGLVHRNAEANGEYGCMKQTITWYDYTGHDITHLNQTYRVF